MGFESANNTNVNQSNGNYEVDVIIFASRFVFRTFKSIDRNLRFLYTPCSASNDWETIKHSMTRENEASFLLYSQELTSGLIELRILMMGQRINFYIKKNVVVLF